MLKDFNKYSMRNLLSGLAVESSLILHGDGKYDHAALALDECMTIPNNKFYFIVLIVLLSLSKDIDLSLLD